MKWKKHGKIFDCKKYELLFAKSPQAVVFDNFVRVYFSTCEKDGDKLISQVSYVDYTKDFKGILEVANNYVISKGSLGCYDEHGIFPFSPVRVGDEIYAYLGGWSRRVSVSADSAIGLAVSKDNGQSFQRLGDGPVIAPSLHEPNLVNDGYVKIIDGVFHMWYIYGIRWLADDSSIKEPERVYKITHAVSKNGVDWEREGKPIIADILNKDECQALPTVIEINGRYHMFFCFRQARDFRKNKKNAYRIGYAFSDDLKTWNRDDESVGITVSDFEGKWDSQMICYPNVFACEDKIYMLYNGNEFGKYGFGLAEMEEFE